MIEQFNIDINLDKILPEADAVEGAKDKPKMNINISVPTISLQLKPHIYNNLLRMGEFMSYSKDSAMELMEDERLKLMQGNSKLGMVFVKETRLRDIVWTKYLCIFKGRYLYFFKNASDTRPSFTYYIRNAEVTARDDLEKEHALSVSTYKSISL